MAQRWLDRYAHGLAAHPWLGTLLPMALVALLACGSGLLHLRNDTRVFFSQDNPELQALQRFEKLYHRSDNLLFVVSARGGGDLFTPARLQALLDLTDRSWQLPHIKRVNSPTNFQRVAAEDGTITIDHLLRRGDPLTPEIAATLRSRALEEPLLVGRLLTEDAQVGLVASEFRLDEQSASAEGPGLVVQARAIAQEFAAAHPDLEFRVSGSLALDSAFGEANAHDMSVLVPVMISVILGLLGWIMRSLPATLLSTAVIGLSIAGALGVTGLLGIPLSSPSLTAPYIILTIATADCVHLLTAVAQYLGEGRDRPKAVTEAIEECFTSITLTSWTTASGFYSLMFSASPPFQHLGFIAGTGAMLAWLLSVTSFPAAMVLMPFKAHSDPQWIRRFCLGIARFSTKHATGAIAGSLIFGAVFSALAFTNRLDDQYIDYFDQSFAFRRDADFLNQHLGGIYSMEFSLDSAKPDGVTDPEYLGEVASLSEWLRGQRGVTHVYGLSDVMKKVNQAMNDGRADAYVLPPDPATSAQYLALYEMSLPVGLDLKEQVTVDKAQSRLTATLNQVSTADVLDLEQRAHRWAEQHTPRLASSVDATGMTVIFSHIGMRNINDMLYGTFLELLIVGSLLFFAFRSWRASAVGMIANLVPGLAALGGWALAVGEVGMAAAAVITLTLGIVVDDTIHFTLVVLKAQKTLGMTPEQAVHHAFATVGPALVTTGILLGAGFGCLALSGFQINRWLGLMTAITIAVAVLFDFFFVPAALTRFRRL